MDIAVGESPRLDLVGHTVQTTPKVTPVGRETAFDMSVGHQITYTLRVPPETKTVCLKTRYLVGEDARTDVSLGENRVDVTTQQTTATVAVEVTLDPIIDESADRKTLSDSQKHLGRGGVVTTITCMDAHGRAACPGLHVGMSTATFYTDPAFNARVALDDQTLVPDGFDLGQFELRLLGYPTPRVWLHTF
jgi:hypothetical protein